MSKFKCGLCGETSTFAEVDKANKVIYEMVEDIQTLIDEEVLFDHMQWCPKCDREIMPEFYTIIEE